MPLRIPGVDTVLRCIALRLWWLLLCIALLRICLRLPSWFIRHLRIARFIILSFGDTTHTGRVPTVIAGRLEQDPAALFCAHSKSCQAVRADVGICAQLPRKAHRAAIFNTQAQESTRLLALQSPEQAPTEMRNYAAGAKRAEG